MTLMTPRLQRGFSMIEVLVALLVLAVGLLGAAMLQTLNVRYTQSAQQRTIATNMAYEYLDMMRAQRVLASRFALDKATVEAVTVPAQGVGCPRAKTMKPEDTVAQWTCELRVALPNSSADVTLLGDGQVEIAIRWGDEFWKTDEEAKEFVVASRL